MLYKITNKHTHIIKNNNIKILLFAHHACMHTDTDTHTHTHTHKTYLVKILHLTPTAEFCASPMDNSTTFSILKLGPSMAITMVHGCLVRSAFCWYSHIPSCFVYLPEQATYCQWTPS